jgi:hypothetical protein
MQGSGRARDVIGLYKRILEFWISERDSVDLQRPPRGFEDDLKKYIEGLSTAENGVQGKLLAAEAARAKEMSVSFKALRREKICRALVAGTLSEEFLFDEEADFGTHGKAAVEPAPDGAKKILARLLRDVPSFVGADLKTYGPYKTEDVVLLPAQNAEALIKRGIAMEIQKRV